MSQLVDKNFKRVITNDLRKNIDKVWTDGKSPQKSRRPSRELNGNLKIEKWNI